MNSEKNEQTPSEIKEETIEQPLKEKPEIITSKEIKIIPAEEYEQLKSKENELKEVIDLLQRTRADYLNYIKIAKKQQEETKEYALQEFFQKLIPYLIMLDTALLHCNNSDNVKAIKEGVELIASEFKRILKEEGLEEINPLNMVFDPQIAEAIETIETNEEKEDNIICEVVTRGYKLKNRVLLPAKVKIKKYSPPSQNNTPTPHEEQANPEIPSV